MDDRNMKFTCDFCEYEWERFDYQDEEKFEVWREGYECPSCESEDISGQNLN